MHRGYVKIWRKIEDSGLMQTPNTLALFMYILLNATHKTIKVGTPSGVIDLHRGQYISGRKELASRLKQSEQQIRTSLDRLTMLGIISVNSTNRYSVYTIENYSVYQDINQQDNQQITNSQPTDNQQITTKQEHKHINTERNISTQRGSRLPTDWEAPQQFIDFCEKERPDLDANFVADQFKDYWISTSGKSAIKTDWFATWRNWVRRQEQSKSKFKNKSSIISDSQFDDWLEGRI
jgi:hypothetical protein